MPYRIFLILHSPPDQMMLNWLWDFAKLKLNLSVPQNAQKFTRCKISRFVDGPRSSSMLVASFQYFNASSNTLHWRISCSDDYCSFADKRACDRKGYWWNWNLRGFIYPVLRLPLAMLRSLIHSSNLALDRMWKDGLPKIRHCLSIWPLWASGTLLVPLKLMVLHLHQLRQLCRLNHCMEPISNRCVQVLSHYVHCN